MAALDDAIILSHLLADPGLDSAILAEGNVSVRDGDRFWVKASGRRMATAGPADFSRVDPGPVLAALESELDDAGVRALLAASADGPSVETFMHAALLELPGVETVGHAHPVALLGLLCSDRAEEEAGRRYFPDEVVCCGPSSPCVPYVDPGLPLARAVRAAALGHAEAWGEPPKTIWLANHGLIALGKNPATVESAFAMTVKAARVRLAGATRPLTEREIDRIHTRPDEHHRQRALGLR